MPPTLVSAVLKAGARVGYEVVGRMPTPRREHSHHKSVMIFGADHKFISPLARQLDRQPELEVKVQQWPRWTRYPPLHLARQLSTPEVLVAEWTRQNAIWASHHKRPGQMLITRLHRFELDSSYPGKVNVQALDAVVHISPWTGKQIRDQLGWPVEKLVYLPNYVHLASMDRPKLADPQFRLGLAGALPQRKRLDLALDLLRQLRHQDARYSLSVRMPAPWSVPYVAKRAPELAFYSRCFQRIETDPLLRGAVSFDGFGADLSSWLRGVGHILSCADSEGNPVAVAEAMASGAVPIVREWPGSGEVLGDWTVTSITEAAQRILEAADLDTWWQASQQARAQVWRDLDPTRVIAGWSALLQGDLASARAQFPAGQVTP